MTKKMQKFCSLECRKVGRAMPRKTQKLKDYWAGNKGKNNPFWKGGRHRHSHGYVLIYAPEHPRGSRRYVYEHILVVEKNIGRFLKQPEEVHHINGIKNDNRIENLKLCATHKEHMRYEQGYELRERIWYKPCKTCGEKLELESNFYKRSNGRYFYMCKGCFRPIIRAKAAERRRRKWKA